MQGRHNSSDTHISYNEYKKTIKKKSNKDVKVFISVFVIGVLIILGFAKILSPNVDVGIADNSEYSDSDSNEDTNNDSGSIDSRLKFLQMEDSGNSAEDDKMFSPDLDEKVVLPAKLRKTSTQMEAEMLNSQSQKVSEPVNIVQNKHSDTIAHNEKAGDTFQEAPSQIISAKVVVGYYATEKQAEVAKSILQDSGIGINPIVKNMGSYYTLQVGSYSTKEKAQQAANNLLKSNFPARVILE